MNSLLWLACFLLAVCTLAPFPTSAWDVGNDVSPTVASSLLTEEDKAECKECDLDKCPPVTNCNMGIVRDKCGCCDVCGLEEGHLCNLHSYEPHRPWYGSCGVNLECRLRTDIDKSQVGNQSICYCIKDGKVCSSDDKTYSKCEMQAIENKSNKKIHMISQGYCKTKPEIITIAEDRTVDKESKVSFLCEVTGFPLPSVIWYFTSPRAADTVKLPGDNDEISVTFRGGPQANRITSHLQITDFQINNEGRYQCFADNDMGMTTETFTLVLSEKKH